MEFTSQVSSVATQDPGLSIALIVVIVVLFLMALSFWLGFLLGRTGSHPETKAPARLDNQPPPTQPTPWNAIPVPVHQSPTPIQRQPAVSVSRQVTVSTLDPAPQAPITTSPPVVAAPNLEATQGREATASTQSPARKDPEIITRTGTNPYKTKLVDPYAESERVWSSTESAEAVRLSRSGKSIVAIATAMKIDQRQVAIHLIRVVFKFDGEIDNRAAAPRDGWRYTPDEQSKMDSYAGAGMPIQDIATALERTVLGVGWRILDRRVL